MYLPNVKQKMYGLPRAARKCITDIFLLYLDDFTSAKELTTHMILSCEVCKKEFKDFGAIGSRLMQSKKYLNFLMQHLGARISWWA